MALFDTTLEKLTRFRHSEDGQIDSSFLIGAWPLFVGRVIGLVNSVYGRDHCQLNNVSSQRFQVVRVLLPRFLSPSARTILARVPQLCTARPLCPYQHSGQGQATRWARVWGTLAALEEQILDALASRLTEQVVDVLAVGSLTRSASRRSVMTCPCRKS